MAKKSSIPNAAAQLRQQVTEAAADVRRDADALAEFVAENGDLVSRYNELRGEANNAIEQLKAVAKGYIEAVFKRNGNKLGGELLSIEASGVKLVVKETTPREVDVELLLRELPNAAKWAGLLSVNLGQFDALVSTNVLTEAQVKRVLKKPPDKPERMAASVAITNDEAAPEGE